MRGDWQRTSLLISQSDPSGFSRTAAFGSSLRTVDFLCGTKYLCGNDLQTVGVTKFITLYPTKGV
jgi:hypothetical protein